MKIYRYKRRLIPCFGWQDAPYDLMKKTARIGGKSAKDPRKYLHQVVALDIETTAYFEDAIERRAMFHWQVSYNNEYLITGRTMEELLEFLQHLSDALGFARVTIIVQNLSYENMFLCQALHNQFGDLKYFMLASRKVQSFECANLRFVDTAVMSGMSLERMSIDYDLYYKKAAGDFDYNKLFSVTDPLDRTEFGYCVLDVFALVDYWHTVQKLRGYTTAQMPITKTSFIRKPLRSEMMHGYFIDGRNYSDWIRTIQNDYETYKMLRAQFAGGIVVLNAGYHGHVLSGDIRCRDFTSSYPYVMSHPDYYYPMTAYMPYGPLDLDNETDLDKFLFLMENNCCLFKVIFYDLQLKPTTPAAFISASKCEYVQEGIKHNGKICAAEMVVKYVNEVEFKDIIERYTYSDLEIDEMRTARRGQLPDKIIDWIRRLFTDKTQLKGIEGKELEYLLSKGDLNGLYGMMAMDPLRESFKFSFDEMAGDPEELTEEEKKEKYEKAVRSRNNFLNYAWGCYVTTWARHNLLKAMDIANKHGGWIYSDTDSVYYFSTPDIEKDFDEWNKTLMNGAISARSEVTGKVSTLGEMEPDGCYTKFLGYGAKKYWLEKPDGKIKMTVAGVPKRNKQTGQDINDWVDSIEDIHVGMIFTGEMTGKLRPDYVVQPLEKRNVNGVMTTCGAYINLLPCDYQLNDSVYEDWLYNPAPDSYLLRK